MVSSEKSKVRIRPRNRLPQSGAEELHWEKFQPGVDSLLMCRGGNKNIRIRSNELNADARTFGSACPNLGNGEDNLD